MCVVTLQDRTSRKQCLSLLNIHVLYLLVRGPHVSGLEAPLLWDSLGFNSPSVCSDHRPAPVMSTDSVWECASLLTVRCVGETTAHEPWAILSLSLLDSNWRISLDSSLAMGWGCRDLLPTCRAWLLESQMQYLPCILKANLLLGKRAFEKMSFRFTSSVVYRTWKTHVIATIQTRQTSLPNADATHAKMSASPHISLPRLAILDLLPCFLSLLLFSFCSPPPSLLLPLSVFDFAILATIKK